MLTTTQVDHIFNKLSAQYDNESISLYEIMKKIESTVMTFVPEEQKAFKDSYFKAKHTVGGLKPIPQPKTIQDLYKLINVSYNPKNELYFKGHQTKRGRSLPKLKYKDLPSIITKSRQFITDRFKI